MTDHPPLPAPATPASNPSGTGAFPTSRRLPGWSVWLVLAASFGATWMALMVRRPLSPAPTKIPLVQIGDTAPDFSLRDSQKEPTDPPISLSSLLDHGPVVIVFIRSLNCPPCMQYLAHLARQDADFKSAGIQIAAITPDPPGQASRDAIIAFGAFPFPLLSDPGDRVATAYGLASTDIGFLEGTFVVNHSRRLLYVKRSDEPVGEVAELLSAGKAALNPH